MDRFDRNSNRCSNDGTATRFVSIGPPSSFLITFNLTGGGFSGTKRSFQSHIIRQANQREELVIWIAFFEYPSAAFALTVPIAVLFDSEFVPNVKYYFQLH